MKIGAVFSKGGGAFFSAYDLLLAEGYIKNQDVIAIMDRTCGAEQEAEKRNIRSFYIEYTNKNDFSSKILEICLENEVAVIFLYYSRVVSAQLYNNIVTINIHPSLLPCFKGMGAVKQACQAKVRFLGATAHLVTEEIDAGEIIGQVVSPINFNQTEMCLQRVSFVQKVYLTLCCFELLENNFIEIGASENKVCWLKEVQMSASANPIIPRTILQKAFENFQSQFNIKVV